MAKLLKPTSEVMRGNSKSSIEVPHTENEYSALKKKLADCKSEAEADAPLLASGLRLALANEALQVENARLLNESVNGILDQEISDIISRSVKYTTKNR